MIHLGDYDTTETVIIPFNTFSSDDPSASCTITDLAASDVEIHKDGGTTQRSSDNGVTVSINFDGVTGNHIVSIDLSDNSDAGFYAAGSRYQVRIEGTTIDGATVNAWIGTFSIGCTLRAATDGRTLAVESDGHAHADVKEWLGVAPLALSSQQVQSVVPSTQKVDVETIKTQALTASAGITFGVYVGGTAAHAIASTALTNATWTDARAGYLNNLNGHTPQTGDSYAYLGTNLGAFGANATEAGGTGDHLTAVPWNTAWEAQVKAQAVAAFGVTVPAIYTSQSVAALVRSGVYLANGAHGGAAASITLADYSDFVGSGGGDATEAKQDTIIAALAVVDEIIDNIILDTNELQTDWSDGGRLDNLLDSAVGAAAGSGARTVTVTVDDGSDPLESAKVRFTKGAESYVQTTDASGNATFNLDDGTWTVAISLALYSYGGTSQVVDSDETPTYSMTAVSITASDPDYTTLYGYVYAENAETLQYEEVGTGTVVYLEMVAAPSGTGKVLDIGPRTATTNASGLVQWTNCVQGAKYQVYYGTNQARFPKTAVTVGTESTQQIPNIVGEA